MKFALVVVLLAFAVGVQSSVLGLNPWGLPLGLGHVSVDHSAWGAPLLGHGLLAGHGLYGGHGVLGGHAIPGIALAQGPAIGHTGLGVGLGHGIHDVHGPGVYVAKTRGAVHTAPLAGHIASATSVNVAPAPGTI